MRAALRLAVVHATTVFDAAVEEVVVVDEEVTDTVLVVGAPVTLVDDRVL